MEFPHRPVLINEVLGVFSDAELRVFADGTLGAGGHAEALLAAHPEIEFFLGVDQDPDALEIASERLKKYGSKVHCVRGNYRDINRHLDAFSIAHLDGVLLDLGVSSMQLDRPERGMSFSKEGPLDMRMDPEGEVTAEVILNTWPEDILGMILRDYGEEPRWRAAAGAIVSARGKKPLKTTLDLVQVLRPILYRKTGRQINPMTLVFQALRIAVNNELEVLSDGVTDCISLLSPGGRMAVISFHSLEDRIVKNAFREASGYKGGRSEGLDLPVQSEPTIKIITRKPIVPSLNEQKDNPRSRSAKMRVVEKL